MNLQSLIKEVLLPKERDKKNLLGLSGVTDGVHDAGYNSALFDISQNIPAFLKAVEEDKNRTIFMLESWLSNAEDKTWSENKADIREIINLLTSKE